jgi:hypothetical protein
LFSDVGLAIMQIAGLNSNLQTLGHIYLK